MARISEEVARFDPEFIFHLAAQPIVLDARENGIETVDINVTGTACVLESARRAWGRAVVPEDHRRTGLRSLSHVCGVSRMSHHYRPP